MKIDSVPSKTTLDSTGSTTRPRLAIALTFGILAMIPLIAFASISKENANLLFYLCGSFNTAFIGMVNYYFGDSRSADDQRNTIGKFVNNQANEHVTNGYAK